MPQHEPVTAGFLDQHPPATTATPVLLVRKGDYADWRKSQDAHTHAWLDRAGVKGQPGQIAWLPSEEASDSARVIAVTNDSDDLSTLGHLPRLLSEGDYQLQGGHAVSDLAIIGWGLGAYQFTRYQGAERAPAMLAIPGSNNADYVRDVVACVTLTRDLINTPANDMLPSHMAAEAQQLADAFGASCEVTTGEALLDMNCGALHAVGRASDDEPCLIDLVWGDESHPKITLVGKGVCFDSGGLNIKPAAGMRWMKKDMGGAAAALGLAQLIMARGLKVRLRLLVAAAENAISANAYRPGDVLVTHKGLTVEIDNTDAEGRLVMCDALSIAAQEDPALVVDFATLTGSARAAVGTEMGAMFSNNNAIASAIVEAGEAEDDLVWQLPLHEGYDYMLESKVADTVNSAGSPYGGAITAALFLKKFIGDHPWVHFDIMAFNNRARPGRPEGGEAMALRAVFRYLSDTYGSMERSTDAKQDA